MVATKAELTTARYSELVRGSDGELTFQGTNRNAGSFFGIVDTATPSANINDVTIAPPYSSR